jgi:hypothetical protein
LREADVMPTLSTSLGRRHISAALIASTHRRRRQAMTPASRGFMMKLQASGGRPDCMGK